MEFKSYCTKTNSELKEMSKSQLKGKWLIAILVCFVVWILTEGISFKIESNQVLRTLQTFNLSYGETTNYSTSYDLLGLIKFLIGGPVEFGLALFFLNIVRNVDAKFENLFSGFKYFINTFALYLLKTIFVWLWTLLLIIPGIIASLSYSMSFYIMNDNPEVGVMEAIKQSKQMMKGNKGTLFVLYLSFIGWFILSILTLGIGLLWLKPYVNTTVANFYENLKYNTRQV